MAGEGSNSKVGLKTETTPGTAVLPDTVIPFVSCSFAAPRNLVQSNSIRGGTPARSKGVAGVFAASGTIVQEMDCESTGKLIYYVNGDEGYTANGEFGAAAKITAAPTLAAGLTDGTIPTGNYYYKVASVLTQTATGLKCIMPASASSLVVAVALGEKVTITFTDPTTLTLPTGFTYYGTAIYRTAAGGANTTQKFICVSPGSAATYINTGAETTADTTIIPVPATTLYSHTFKAAAAASGQPRLKSFTTQISKNVSDDERFAGCMVSDMALEVGGADAIVQATFNCQALGVAPIDGEFSASAATVRRPIAGHQVSAIINDTLSCEVQTFSLNLNNDIAPLYGLCNTPNARKLATNSLRTVSGSFTLTYETQSLWAKAVNDESISLDIKMWGEPILNALGSLSTALHGVQAVPFPRLCDINMESVTLSDFSNPIEGPGQIIATANYQADYDSGTTTEMTITLVNTTADYEA